ncbi:response regulator [Curvivirga sp.]|uniref:response regulator n=1 Tax=Curvivirga sp. TaxID=2856848 RepID=UPI003B58B56B
MSVNNGLSDETYNTLRAEFIDWIDTELTAMEQCIDEGTSDTFVSSEQDSTTVRLMRMAHNIKGSGSAFGFSTVATISHRMEDFMSATSIDLTDLQYRETLLKFIDEMRRVSELASEPNEAESLAIVRALPNSTEYKLNQDSENADLNLAQGKEVLIVSPSKTISAITRKVCESLKHRVTASRNGTEALALAMNMKPDIIIVSTVLTGISGPDLTRALSNMHAIKDIKIILISNLEANHPDLADIPEKVDIINQSGDFPMALFRLLQQF